MKRLRTILQTLMANKVPVLNLWVFLFIILSVTTIQLDPSTINTSTATLCEETNLHHIVLTEQRIEKQTVQSSAVHRLMNDTPEEMFGRFFVVVYSTWQPDSRDLYPFRVYSLGSLSPPA